MFPCSELPDLSADCCSQPVPEVLVAEPPCRPCTYHEVLWKCFPRERLLQALWHGLHFHADLTPRPLGWKARDLGNLALGQHLSLTLGNIPGAILARGLVQQHVATQPLHSAALHVFTSLQKNTIIFFFFKTKSLRLTAVLSQEPLSSSPARLLGRVSASSSLQS